MAADDDLQVSAALARLRPWVIDGALVALSLACCSIYLIKGVGFVLDDWYWLRNAALDGAWHAAGSTGGDRPVGALVYIALFGGIGMHPGVIVAVLALVNGATAVVLRRLILRLSSPAVALLAAGLWLLLPLRTSLEIWMSTGTAALAQLLAVAGLLLLSPRDISWRRAALALALIVAGTLSYESVGVLAIPVAIGVRLAVARRIEPALMSAIVLVPSAALAWAFTHRLGGRHAIGGIRNPLPVFDANFGTGIAPGDVLGATSLCAAAVGSVVVARNALRGGGADRVTRTLLVGWIITVGGVAPYLTYFYSPYGAGDRLNMLSAFGAVLVWAALLAALASWRRPASLAALTVLVVFGLGARLDRAEHWSRAGIDGGRVVADVLAEHPQPDRPIMVGPEPIIVWGIGTFYDHSNIDAALQLAYGTRAVTGVLSYSEAEFESTDPDEFILYDQRPVSTLDELADQ